MPETQFTHRPPRSWQKITIEVAGEYADIAADFLAALTGSGVEFIPQDDKNSPRTTEIIAAYFAFDSTLKDKKNKLKKFLVNLDNSSPGNELHFREELIQEEDWGTSWKKNLKPVQISRRIVIKPSWEKYEADSDQIIIDIDPGMAFGTGLHASTGMSLKFIDDCFTGNKVKSVLDVGTGTGILGIACALLGAGTVLGIDNDPDAVAAAQKNIRANNVDDLMAVTNSELKKISGPFELITANITHDILLKMTPELIALLAPGGSLIMAGILQGQQAESIENSCCSLGLKVAARRCEDEWAAFHFYL
jgi:ribosomal protein L11 methyltransferase